VQLMAANATSTTWSGAPLTVPGKNHGGCSCPC
jgi:hypothetical protein